MLITPDSKNARHMEIRDGGIAVPAVFCASVDECWYMCYVVGRDNKLVKDAKGHFIHHKVHRPFDIIDKRNGKVLHRAR